MQMRLIKRIQAFQERYVGLNALVHIGAADGKPM